MFVFMINTSKLYEFSSIWKKEWQVYLKSWRAYHLT